MSESSVPDPSRFVPRPKETKKPEPLTGGRLTVVETVYHSRPGTQPVSFVSNYSRFLDAIRGDEQPYVRQSVVKDSWTVVDFGWVKSVAMMVLRNEEGRAKGKIPTPGERADIAFRVITLGIAVHSKSDIPPRDSPTKRGDARTMWSPPGPLPVPSDDEAETVSVSIIPFGIVRPGETIRFTPASVEGLVMRCNHVSAKFTLAAFPG